MDLTDKPNRRKKLGAPATPIGVTALRATRQ